MIRLQQICAAAGLVTLLLVFAVPLYAGSMGVSGGHDLDQLVSRAEKQFGLTGRDAVLLLESNHVEILPNGDRRTEIRRVVWIGTGAVIRGYADLRIPYNSATSTLNVTALRTWRDDRWWPHESEISPTAVVETLPYAVALADDYTTMRETMLLHDGVELPCIMETAYEIEERGGAEDGADGFWILPQRDPSVLIEYSVSIPSGESLVFYSGNGAPEPEVTRGADQTVRYVWTMENVDRLGTPHIDDPAGYAPYVSWSTREDWTTLGRKITSSFNEAAVLNVALADTLARCLKHEPTPASKARRIATFVNDCVRSIHYDSRFWSFPPRPASRTWDTAYGHGLDRAVLAAALFREAGLEAEPIYRSAGFSGIDQKIPGLSRFDGITILVSGDELKAFYDPGQGTLSEGLQPLHGRIVWTPGGGSAPSRETGLDGSGADSQFELVLTLEPGEDGSWSGTGFLSANGLFCPYDEMVGLQGEALALVGRIAGSVLQGASVTGFNPEVFERNRVTVGFDFDLDMQEPDDQHRTPVTIGDPSGGITAQFPSDVHLYHEQRGSPVLLSGMMTQRVRLRVKTGDREIIYVPEEREVENEVGRYAIRVEEEDGWVTIDRELMLAATAVRPDAWPSLRALLLEDADSAGRTILMK